MSDMGNGLIAEVRKLFRYLTERIPQFFQVPYLQNLFFRRYTTRIPSSTVVMLSTFRNHISNVVCSRSREKVDWSVARRYVTVVAHIKTFWDWAYSQFVGESMDQGFLLSKRKIAISLPVSASHPQQTRVMIPRKVEVVRGYCSQLPFEMVNISVGQPTDLRAMARISLTRKRLAAVLASAIINIEHFSATSWRTMLGPLPFARGGPFIYFTPVEVQ